MKVYTRSVVGHSTQAAVQPQPYPEHYIIPEIHSPKFSCGRRWFILGNVVVLLYVNTIRPFGVATDGVSPNSSPPYVPTRILSFRSQGAPETNDESDPSKV